MSIRSLPLQRWTLETRLSEFGLTSLSIRSNVADYVVRPSSDRWRYLIASNIFFNSV